jgi:hypothetical protein
LACCTQFIEFANDVGMGGRLHLQERFDAVILSRSGRAGRLRTSAFPAPLHLTPSFAGFPHLTLGEKVRVARALASALFRPPGGESFEGWLVRNGQGAGERRAFWDPFFIPAINAPFDRVAAADAIFVLKTAFLGDAGAARFGFSTVPLAHLAAAAAQRLDTVRTSTAVLSVRPTDSGATLRLPDESVDFDGVVLAVPPRQVERMLEDPHRYGIANLDRYDPTTAEASGSILPPPSNRRCNGSSKRHRATCAPAAAPPTSICASRPRNSKRWRGARCKRSFRRWRARRCCAAR